MSREQSLRNGAALMVLGALIFFVYAVVFFFRAFASGGFEVGVETLNGVTPQQLDGLWWAWITGVIVPVLGLAVALPLHYMGRFNYDWVSHLGPIYLGTIIYVVGAVVALIGLSQATPDTVQAAR